MYSKKSILSVIAVAGIALAAAAKAFGDLEVKIRSYSRYGLTGVEVYTPTSRVDKAYHFQRAYFLGKTNTLWETFQIKQGTGSALYAVDITSTNGVNNPKGFYQAVER